MKRGFLTSAKAKARPLGPPPTPSAPTAPASSHGIVSAPVGATPEIIVLPPNASPNEPVTVCIFWPGSKEELAKAEGFPKALREFKPGFRVGPVVGKGLGLLATRPYRQGELIMDERPLLVSIRGLPSIPATMSPAEHLSGFEKYLEDVLQRMRPADREAFMSLHNSHLTDGSGPIGGRIRTNGFGLEGLAPGIEGPMGSYSVVANQMSRMNNSCSPNTGSRWIDASISYNVFAVRDIAEGEELTLTYAEPLDPAAKRQLTFRPYGFSCTCDACRDPTKSDARRATIVAFKTDENDTSSWAYNSALSDDWLIKRCLKQLALIEQEKLESVQQYYDVLYALFECYMALGDTQKASEWAVRAYRATAWTPQYDPFFLQHVVDPNSTAYQANPLWRGRVDRTDITRVARIQKRLAEFMSANGFPAIPEVRPSRR
ncbi:Aldehyde dehydrogenase [Mycena kentingensis (nom. inval.)]|nr:Aldehyde dehydrogenase [Mycena kentingensis (nom. inval.)]